jgi:hypothetical protein
VVQNWVPDCQTAGERANEEERVQMQPQVQLERSRFAMFVGLLLTPGTDPMSMQNSHRDSMTSLMLGGPHRAQRIPVRHILLKLPRQKMHH